MTKSRQFQLLQPNTKLCLTRKSHEIKLCKRNDNFLTLFWKYVLLRLKIDPMYLLFPFSAGIITFESDWYFLILFDLVKVYKSAQWGASKTFYFLWCIQSEWGRFLLSLGRWQTMKMKIMTIKMCLTSLFSAVDFIWILMRFHWSAYSFDSDLPTL